MELSPEEYGAYWGGAVRIAAGLLVALLGYRLVDPFLAHPQLPPTVLGIVMVSLFVLAGSYIATLGLARVVRTAVRAES